MEKAKNITRSALLAFVLVSIGFLLGKEMTARRQTRQPNERFETSAKDKVVVYLHTTFRCVTQRDRAAYKDLWRPRCR
jgi:hypothetical protein